MGVLVNYESNGDSHIGLGDVGGNEYHRAQSFQLANNSTIESIEIYLKDGTAAPTDDITVRIETDSGAGIPSGSLADANATGTIAASGIGAAYGWHTCTFATSFALVKATAYHIVCTLPNQANNTFFYWYADSNEGYASGTLSTNIDGAGWSNSSYDMYFRVNGSLTTVGNMFLVF